jgi:hypothetical protein
MPDAYELENDEEDSMPPVLTQQRTLRGCRKARLCFSDDQPIRHTIGEHSWTGLYDASKHCIWHKGECYEGNAPMYQFTKAHYRHQKPNRSPENNAWLECECLINCQWISTYNLPAI